jgi:hypothetical protein
MPFKAAQMRQDELSDVSALPLAATCQNRVTAS